MLQPLSILYRGPLSSCNYGCEYCPFAKRRETREELEFDAKQLSRFVDWVEQQSELRTLSIFFTPWGEAMIRPWYQQAIIRLSNMAHIAKVAIQTNLSANVDWLETCRRDRVGLWCTYHPSEVSRNKFLQRCQELDRLQISYSVGMVGLKEHADEIENLRRELSPHVYFWINAYKRVVEYYSPDELMAFQSIDPLFGLNNTRHVSQGMPCRTGNEVISVDGEGTIRRCHFVQTAIGNIYDTDWQSALQERPCPNATCGCHIGYVHLKHLELESIFGKELLERIPSKKVWCNPRNESTTG